MYKSHNFFNRLNLPQSITFPKKNFIPTKTNSDTRTHLPTFFPVNLHLSVTKTFVMIASPPWPIKILDCSTTTNDFSICQTNIYCIQRCRYKVSFFYSNILLYYFQPILDPNLLFVTPLAGPP